jgi:hypothetical protein
MHLCFKITGAKTFSGHIIKLENALAFSGSFQGNKVEQKREICKKANAVIL